ncbi:MAG: YggS family pyridoxal phosphate-dependent enzyme [Nanoarchaeota archaeon]|nr:YggS family pyridoxal phosphate-dependent enzyme [Nanoarchaeota archaeon]MBU1321042.1 YggS family pyridoxal phosphate-dependent enzyme [Nanoarchaeota archaeon]MBU1598456.1 YggS family pyridoxal phosphate-dependent enzyme [Nanoarchaeota archaeon]MBU2441382.1 YggS family pyridoxal phosphate-dependent enzyme [Nanoarchaeota archaeon]
MGIQDNVNKILKEIPSNVTLVAAIKYANIEQIKELIDAGVTELGVNRLEQLEQVKQELPDIYLSKVKFHFIGHLQRNKVKKVMELGVGLIQSVDSYKLADKINKICIELGKSQDVLIQVKTDDDKEAGISPNDLDEFVRQIKELEMINVVGLMTIPPFSENPEDSRQYFSIVAGLLEVVGSWMQYPLEILSMGMSDDYKIAIEEGANMVRVGRVLYE